MPFRGQVSDVKCQVYLGSFDMYIVFLVVKCNVSDCFQGSNDTFGLWNAMHLSTSGASNDGFRGVKWHIFRVKCRILGVKCSASEPFSGVKWCVPGGQMHGIWHISGFKSRILGVKCHVFEAFPGVKWCHPGVRCMVFGTFQGPKCQGLASNDGFLGLKWLILVSNDAFLGLKCAGYFDFFF